MPTKFKIDLDALGISLSSGDIQFDFPEDFIKQTTNPYDPGNGPSLKPGILKVLMVNSGNADLSATASVTASGSSIPGLETISSSFTTTATGNQIHNSGLPTLTGSFTTSINYPIIQINSVPAIASSFTTTSAGSSTPTELANITIDRAYTENTITTNLFSSTPPTLTTGQPTLDHTVRFEITNYNNASEDGWLKDNTNSAVAGGAVKTLEFTGTKSEIDTWLASNVRYIPPPAISSTQRIDVTVLQGSLTTQTTSFDINGTANASAVADAGRNLAWNGTSNYLELDITDNMRYFLKADVLLIGGGGKGGSVSGTNPTYAAGGGGAGGVIEKTGSEFLKNSSYSKVRMYGGSALTSGTKSEDLIFQDYSGGTVGSDIAVARGGGHGADGGYSSGLTGGSGGHGGGGGGFNGSGGSVMHNINQWVAPTGYTTGNTVEYNAGGQNANGTSPGGDGGGPSSFTSTVLNASAESFAFPGPGGNSSTTLYTQPGSGGHGQSKDTLGNTVDAQTSGQTGRAGIYFYEY